MSVRSLKPLPTEIACRDGYIRAGGVTIAGPRLLREEIAAEQAKPHPDPVRLSTLRTKLRAWRQP